MSTVAKAVTLLPIVDLTELEGAMKKHSVSNL